MAGDRVGRINQGARYPQTVRFPLDHHAYYVAQAESLGIPTAAYIAYRMAAIDGLKIPNEVLLAHPGVLELLPDGRRAAALQEIPGLTSRYQTYQRAMAAKQQADQMELQLGQASAEQRDRAA